MSKLPIKRKETKGQFWKTNPNMESDFIAYCLESAALHKYKGSSLKSWTCVITKMNAKYGSDGLVFDHKLLKNKWTSLRSGYVQWRRMTLKTGHGRNEDGTFNWSSEEWDEQVKLNKSIARFRREPLKHFVELEKLFEGTYASGDDQYNPVLEDIEEIDDDDDDDNMNASVEGDNEYCVDFENDAYYSSAKEDISPGTASVKGVSHGQDSIPVSNKGQASSDQRKGKRKLDTSGGLIDITEILQSHIASTEIDRVVLRRKIGVDEEISRKKLERLEMLDKKEEERTKKSEECSVEECCKIINAMKDIPEVKQDDSFYTLAKIAISESAGLRASFMSETTVEDKVFFLKSIMKKI